MIKYYCDECLQETDDLVGTEIKTWPSEDIMHEIFRKDFCHPCYKEFIKHYKAN